MKDGGLIGVLCRHMFFEPTCQDLLCLRWLVFGWTIMTWVLGIGEGFSDEMFIVFLACLLAGMHF